MTIARKTTISDGHARALYTELKQKIGKRRALKATGLRRRGMDERDLYRCTLSGRIKTGIQLMHEKYCRDINHGEAAKDQVWG